MMNEMGIKKFFAKSQNGELGILKVRFPSLTPFNGKSIKTSFNYFEDVQVTISAELGKTVLKVRDVLKLEEGSLIQLDKAAGDAVDLFINEKKFGLGEVIVISDLFGIRLLSINLPNKLNDVVGNE